MTAVPPTSGSSDTAVGVVDSLAGPTPGRSRPRSRVDVVQGYGAVVKGYVALTKPRIIELLLVTTVPVMFLAAGGVPDLGLVAATMVGGVLAAGSANAFNCVLDRDIDEAMRRTRRRPLPRHQVGAVPATVFAAVLAVAATFWLGLAVNWLSSLLAMVANGFYIFVYTMLLKRRTAQNVVWGGIAGCFPTLIGWTAVTGRLALAPFILFAVVFFWTPPHTWALAMRYRDDYAVVGVPMLPVVAGPVKVAAEICTYTVAMIISSLLLWPVAHTGPLYPLAGGVFGLAFLTEAIGLLRRARAGLTGAALKPMRLFHWSNSYLALLFLAAAIDPLIH